MPAPEPAREQPGSDSAPSPMVIRIKGGLKMIDHGVQYVPETLRRTAHEDRIVKRIAANRTDFGEILVEHPVLFKTRNRLAVPVKPLGCFRRLLF